MITHKKTDIQGALDRYRILVSSMFGVCVLFLVNGQAVISAYAPDDYSSVEQATSADFFLQQGRLGQAAHSVIFNRLGISIADSGPAWWVLFFASFALCTSLVIDTILGKKASFFSVALPTALIVSSPYWSTLLMYRRTVPDFFAAFALLAGFVYFYRRMSVAPIVRNSFFSGVCLALALTFYQPVFPIAVLLVIWDNANRDKFFDVKWLTASLSTVLFTLAIYAAIFAFTKNIAGPGWDNRASLLTASNVGTRIQQIKDFLPLLYADGFYIVNKAYTIAATLLSLVSAIYIIFVLRAKSIIFGVAYIASVAVVLAPIAILSDWDPTTRNLSAFAYLTGILSAVALSNTHVKIISRKSVYLSLSAALAFMVILSTIISDAYFLDFARKNKQNSWIAQQVAEDLISIQNDHHISSVKIVNNPNGRLYTPGWAVRGVIFEATGFRFPITNATEDDIKFCEASSKWPSNGYITVNGDGVIACIE